VETSLNLAWAILATAMFMFWLRYRPCYKASGVQLAALAVCILTLLPVISISDDLMAAQFPAESDSSQHWELRASHSHAVYHAAAMPTASSASMSSMPVVKLTSQVSRLAFVLPQVSTLLADRAPPTL
jgi:hypothetical protein